MLKRLSGPVRHYFNSRFSAIHQSVVQGHVDDHQMLSATLAGVDRLTEQVEQSSRLAEQREQSTGDDVQQVLALLGRSLDDIQSQLDLLAENSATLRLNALEEQLDSIARRVGLIAFDPGTQGQLPQLGEYEAAVANFAHAHNGWAAQAGLWFNPPLSMAHATGGVSLTRVNERIAEVPFVFRQLAGLPEGARILDIGSTESTVSLSLATLGYRVTAVDPRPSPLSHPNLTTFQGPIADFMAEDPFDAVVFLSSIEHFGIGSYELAAEENADLTAMAHVQKLSRPGTRLILTTPFGNATVSSLERTYDPERLEMLLEGWEVEEKSYLSRVSYTEWQWQPSIDDLDGNHVVLVRARLAGGDR